jgi:uncharacterized protein (TIGR03435 family)
VSWMRSVGALLAASSLVLAQETPAPHPAFEVASVKVSGPQSKRDSGGGPGTRDPGQYHFYSARLLDLIVIAYHVDSFQVLSKSSLERGNFDVLTKVPAGATRDQFREMLQNLLEERFHLKLHRESREFPAWEMTIAKSGLKIKESAVSAAATEMSGRPTIGNDGFPELSPNQPGFAARFTFVDGFIVARLAAQRQSLSVLSHSFGSQDDLPLVDRTGLTGKYDFRLEFSREPPGAANAQTGEAKVPPVPELFTAMEQQLGLHLAPKKLPFDVLVVDAFDSVPTEN